MAAERGPRRLAGGSKLLDRASLDVRFPLHYAVLNGQMERVCFLLGVPAPGAGGAARRGPGLRADDEDDLGRTPLHVAAAFGHVEICRLILGLDKTLVHGRAHGMQGVYPAHVLESSLYREIQSNCTRTLTFENVARQLHVACAGGWERDNFLSDEDFYAMLGGADEAHADEAPTRGQPARGKAPARSWADDGKEEDGEGKWTELQQRRLAVVTLLFEFGADATARTEAGTSPYTHV
jgi:ankyrin repeat protein